MDNTITLYFKWNTSTPDPRQFNQQRQVMYPFTDDCDDYLASTVIAIQIPLKGEYVFNASEILAAQISSDEDAPDPILTPAGMFLAISLLEAPFAKVGEDVKDEKKALDDEWGDDKDDGWGEAIVKVNEEKHPWETKADPPPEDTPQPTESVVEAKSDDAWEDVIAVDEIKEDEKFYPSDDDTPDWENHRTWETKTVDEGDK